MEPIIKAIMEANVSNTYELETFFPVYAFKGLFSIWFVLCRAYYVFYFDPQREILDGIITSNRVTKIEGCFYF